MARYREVALEAAESVPALLYWLKAQGFELAASGERLRIRPADRVTPQLRDRIARHKTALLRALSPHPYVTLKGGLIVPAPALLLAWRLEDRGFRLGIEADGQIAIEPAGALTNADHTAINRWGRHLGAIVRYVPPEIL